MLISGRTSPAFLIVSLLTLACAPQSPGGQPERASHFSEIGTGFARSSVNAPIFRQSSVITHGADQYAAYYDAEGQMVLAKRRHGSDDWETLVTDHRGNVADAHNSISLGVDGEGYLHVSWDHHGQPLNYARAVSPGSLQLGEPTGQTGQNESQVTYPGFYPLPDGDLLFLYRDGGSGDGDILLNRYDVAEARWVPVQHPLIRGEGARNAYVNRLVIDADGGWHISWTWRETPDVATNHDVLYAYSPDQGCSWQRSTGEPYELPIVAATAEVAWEVPQASDLINQTSMAVDADGNPMVATYWRDEGQEIPQFRLVWRDASGWRMSQIGARSEAFRLSGGGTKRIPISRPQVIASRTGTVHVIYRELSRGGVTIATSRSPQRDDWVVRDVWTEPVGLWEPSYDPVLWERDEVLHLFLQRVGQGDGEQLEDVPPQPAGVLEVEGLE